MGFYYTVFEQERFFQVCEISVHCNKKRHRLCEVEDETMQAVTSSSYSIENLPPKEVGEFLGIESGRSDDKLKITSPSHNFLKNAKKDISIK